MSSVKRSENTGMIYPNCCERCKENGHSPLDSERLRHRRQFPSEGPATTKGVIIRRGAGGKYHSHSNGLPGNAQEHGVPVVATANHHRELGQRRNSGLTLLAALILGFAYLRASNTNEASGSPKAMDADRRSSVGRWTQRQAILKEWNDRPSWTRRMDHARAIPGRMPQRPQALLA